jgi:hypothetical protein
MCRSSDCRRLRLVKEERKGDGEMRLSFMSKPTHKSHDMIGRTNPSYC